jgi:hypothetical protein
MKILLCFSSRVTISLGLENLSSAPKSSTSSASCLHSMEDSWGSSHSISDPSGKWSSSSTDRWRSSRQGNIFACSSFWVESWSESPNVRIEARVSSDISSLKGWLFPRVATSMMLPRTAYSPKPETAGCRS